MSLPSAYRDPPDVSVVVPFYNEVENVARCHEALTRVLAPSGLNAELIFVNDGSADGTREALAATLQGPLTVRVIHLRRNFGQTYAMSAGIDAARGNIIITMDGDLQNDPADIPLLVQKIHEGNDVVVGWRKDRKDDLFVRKIPSWIANRLIAWLTGVYNHDNGCSLRAYRRELIQKLPLYAEFHRFITPLCELFGPRTSEVVVRHHPRKFGKSKYNLTRTGKVLLDVVTIKMLLSFSSRPLHWFGLLSIPFLLLTVLFSLFTMHQYLTESTESILMPAVTLLMASLAVHFVFTGVLGEHIIGVRRQRIRQLREVVTVDKTR